MLQSLHTMVIPDRHCKTFSKLSISIKNIPNFPSSCSMHSLSKFKKIYVCNKKFAAVKFIMIIFKSLTIYSVIPKQIHFRWQNNVFMTM